MRCPQCERGRLGMSVWCVVDTTLTHELRLGCPGRSWEEYRAMKLAVRFEPPEEGVDPDGMYTDHVFHTREIANDRPGMKLEFLTVPGVVSRKPRTFEEYEALNGWKRDDCYSFFHGVQAECFEPRTWETLPGVAFEAVIEVTEVRSIFVKCGSCSARFVVRGRSLEAWPADEPEDFTGDIPFARR